MLKFQNLPNLDENFYGGTFILDDPALLEKEYLMERSFTVDKKYVAYEIEVKERPRDHLMFMDRYENSYINDSFILRNPTELSIRFSQSESQAVPYNPMFDELHDVIDLLVEKTTSHFDISCANNTFCNCFITSVNSHLWDWRNEPHTILVVGVRFEKYIIDTSQN